MHSVPTTSCNGNRVCECVHTTCTSVVRCNECCNVSSNFYGEIHVHMYVCMYVRMRVCMYVCVYVCTVLVLRIKSSLMVERLVF